MVESHNKGIIQALIKKNTDKVLQLILLPGYDLDFQWPAQKQVTPLILSAKQGLTPVCEKLIELGADIHRRDIEGRTALHHACCSGHPDTVKVLLDAGARIHCFNNDGDHPIHEAVTSGHHETLQTLIAAGCDINRQNHLSGITPLELAVLHGLRDIVCLLLEHKANINHQSNARESVIHYAVQSGNIDIIKQLLLSGANVNAKTYLGETPLTIAIHERKLNVVKFLVDAGCAIGCEDYLSPLCIACRQNLPEIAEYLLSEGYNASCDSQVRRFTFKRFEDEHPELMEYIIHRVENPLTLKELSRVHIRKCLRPDLQAKVESLDVPKVLKDWLIEDNIYKNICDPSYLKEA